VPQPVTGTESRALSHRRASILYGSKFVSIPDLL
jgi:hypothetical protein